MELFALQSVAPGLIRPEMAMQNDLSAVLREGRVLQGEVLQTLDGGSLMIGIGRHRVPARAHVKLEPGQRFLFQVESEAGAIVLRVLGGSGGGDSALLRALRSVVAQDLPLGALLGELQAALVASGPKAEGEGALARLLGQLGQHVFRPGSSGAALADLLQSGGLMFESRLREASLRALPQVELGRVAQTLRGNLLNTIGKAAGLGGPVDPQQLGAELRTALLAILGSDAGPELAHTLSGRELESRLSEALARILSQPALDAALTALARVNLPNTGPGVRYVLLAALMGWDPAAALSGSGAAAGRASLGELARDLKARLLRAFAETPGGPEREAIGRALAGLEAEQLLNLARRESREPMHWSLPVPDGAGWTTAHLFVRRDSDGARGAESGSDEGRRLTIAVEFQHTGPVRADLFIRPDALTMRILVSTEEVRDRAQAALGLLEQALAGKSRRLHLAVGLAAPEDLSVDAELQDIRFLREHHMMDLRG